MLRLPTGKAPTGQAGRGGRRTRRTSERDAPQTPQRSTSPPKGEEETKANATVRSPRPGAPTRQEDECGEGRTEQREDGEEYDTYVPGEEPRPERWRKEDDDSPDGAGSRAQGRGGKMRRTNDSDRSSGGARSRGRRKRGPPSGQGTGRPTGNGKKRDNSRRGGRRTGWCAATRGAREECYKTYAPGATAKAASPRVRQERNGAAAALNIPPRGQGAPHRVDGKVHRRRQCTGSKAEGSDMRRKGHRQRCAWTRGGQGWTSGRRMRNEWPQRLSGADQPEV